MKKLMFLTTMLCPILLTLPLNTHRGSSAPFISGDTFRSVANVIYDEENRQLDVKTIKSGDIVFVKTDYLLTFITEHFPLISFPIIVIVHNSDYGIPGTINHEIFANFLNNDNLIALFGQNVEKFKHPKLHSIPIGIANKMWDHGNPAIFNHVIKNLPPDKPYLLYMNFSPSTYPQERPYVFNLFKSQPFCTVAYPKNLHNYLQEMALHKFTLSPRGNGIDCHRTWEALLVGSIPIVRTSDLDVLYKNLPILIVENWEQVTEEFLIQKYQEISNQKWNLNKKFATYWLSKILNIQQKFKTY